MGGWNRVIGAMVVDDEDEVLLINSNGIIIRIKAGDVSKLGRATQGVKIMKVSEDTEIISMAKVIKEEDITSDKKESGMEKADNGQLSMETLGEEKKK